ncbi:MAG: TraB/GumN family protein [Pseudomonadota bacterium]
MQRAPGTNPQRLPRCGIRIAWRRAGAVLIALLALALPAAPQAAECGGEDLVARLATDDPSAHAALEAAAAAVPNGQARFWRVAREGLAPSFLLGTFHDTEALATVPDGVLARLDRASRLLVELTEEEFAAMEARMTSDPAFVLQLDGRGILKRLPAEERAPIEAALAERGLTLELAKQLRAWMLFSLLAFPACQIEALSEGAEVMDKALIARATAAGLPVAGLERYESALAVFAKIPPEQAYDLARDMIALLDLEEDVRATLLAAYRAGRIGRIKAFSDYIGRAMSGRSAEEAEALNAAFGEAVLDGRNRDWMARLVPALEAGGAFVAVGALHLPGASGLVALLRARGFTVEPEPETP